MAYITPKIYCVDSAKFAHAFYLPELKVLIDCGLPWEGKRIYDEVNRIGEINHILITHADIDHVAGLDAIHDKSKATVWVGKDDVPHMTGRNKRPFPKNIIYQIFAPTLPQDYKLLEDWSHENLQAIHTPGHSEGHYTFLYDNHLFIGDTFKNINNELTPAVKNSDMVEREKTIEIINKIDCKAWIPSHGNPIQKESERKNNQ